MRSITRSSLATLALIAALPAAAPADRRGEIAERRAELQAAKARWSSARIDDYRYRVERICFCLPAEPGRIRVRNGRSLDTKPLYRNVNTVEKLFRVIKRNIDAEILDVRYDRRTGTPHRIGIDRSLQIADEEITYEITGFRELR